MSPHFCSRKSSEFLVRRMGVFLLPKPSTRSFPIRNVILRFPSIFSKCVLENPRRPVCVSLIFVPLVSSENFQGDFVSDTASEWDVGSVEVSNAEYKAVILKRRPGGDTHDVFWTVLPV